MEFEGDDITLEVPYGEQPPKDVGGWTVVSMMCPQVRLLQFGMLILNFLLYLSDQAI